MRMRSRYPRPTGPNLRPPSLHPRADVCARRCRGTRRTSHEGGDTVRLDFLQDLTGRTGPFATVALDATRNDPEGAEQVELRWAALGRRLADLGAPDDVVSRMRDAATSVTGRPGPQGRLLVATAADGVLLDLVLPSPPVRESASWGPVPSLLPAVRAFDGAASYLLALMDSAGADVMAVSRRGEEVDRTSVDGDHDVLHQVPSGGWSSRRYMLRVQDSERGNAVEVAKELASEVGRIKPDLVLVGGEPRPVSELVGHVSGEVASRVVRLEHGHRAAGLDDERLRTEVEQAVAQVVAERDATAVDRFGSAESRQREAVQGLD